MTRRGVNPQRRVRNPNAILSADDDVVVRGLGPDTAESLAHAIGNARVRCLNFLRLIWQFND
jgi:hypothetical protein